MEVTPQLRVGLGLVVGLIPNTATQCVWQQNSSIHGTINDSCGLMAMSKQEFHEHGKNSIQEISQWEQARYRWYE